uniref:Uncharacterized protein n=1 Tax=Pararge aegeria TaxID=116150 RepID=S4PHW2_9NEOP
MCVKIFFVCSPRNCNHFPVIQNWTFGLVDLLFSRNTDEVTQLSNINLLPKVICSLYKIQPYINLDFI